MDVRCMPKLVPKLVVLDGGGGTSKTTPTQMLLKKI